MDQSVFLSYSRHNLYLATRVGSDLTRAGCPGIWFDQLSIPVNEDWEREIEKGIASHDTFVLLWSLEASESAHVQKEYEIAKRNERKIVVILIAGTVGQMPPDLQKLQFIDFTRNYDQGLSALLNWLGIAEPIESPFDLIKTSATHTDAVKTLQISRPQVWFVQDPSRSAAERRRTFVKFPILSSGYSTSWLISDSQKDLELQPELYFVLRFTDDGYRDSVQEVLDYLVLNGIQPQIVFVEGPRNAEGRYDLPDEGAHVWHDAVELVSRLIRMVGGSHTLHFFLHAPQALSFAVASTFTAFQKYHVYNLDRDQSLVNRYQCVFSKPQRS